MTDSSRKVADTLAQHICHSIGQPQDEYGITIETPLGTHVRVTAWSAQQGHAYDRASIVQHLAIETPYTILRKDVGDWRTDIYLAEVPDVAFNSVYFCYLQGEQPV